MVLKLGTLIILGLPSGPPHFPSTPRGDAGLGAQEQRSGFDISPPPWLPLWGTTPLAYSRPLPCLHWHFGFPS